MSYELVICEKPAAAKKIAESLADKKPTRNTYTKKVPYYELTHNGKNIIVACAVGHLYGLTEKEKKGWVYPVYDIEWKPLSETQKSAKFSKQYLNAIKKLAKDADEFTVASDYDVEGEVIGLNIIRYACKKKDANRMKFSTLTKEDLVEAYENKSPSLDWGQAHAGETRHMLDWYYGINTSRALTSAIKTTGMFKLMSTGRVQGPALKLITDKEKERRKFVPKPFWQIQLIGESESQIDEGKSGSSPKKEIDSWHEEGKFWDQKPAKEIYKKISKEKIATIDSVKKKQFKQSPPFPFDLTSLQTEAYRALHIPPKQTLSIAQELYTAGYISYPRTSSQKLPAKIGYKKILNKLASRFPETKIILNKKQLKPNEGKKSDPAHPAIYPTGIIPKKLDKDENNVYELIARRFLATFGDHAVRETMNIKIDCREEIFIAKGTTTLEPGWHKLYGRFTPSKEEELPKVEKGQTIDIKKVELHAKETQPPKRYTEASIIKELEKRNLGTKATRASIIDTLFQRDYTEGKKIKATELGVRTSDTLEKYNPDIVDEALTKEFEEDMEKIREGNEKEETVLEKAKKVLNKICANFKKHEKEIGKELAQAQKETREELSTLGPCLVCNKGNLQIKRGKYGFFAACSRYPDCEATFSFPSNALVKPAKKICETCGFPKILVIKKKKRPQEVCLNPKCPAKLEGYTKKQLKRLEDIESGKLKPVCPKCKKGHLKVRKSVYGSFIACDQYPRCRYVEPLEGEPKKEESKKEKSKRS
ncbi:DNA topoisomerase I [Candidatus Woesearchaeota archaeon]|nr:DNA topoisomerase I [Candidatus Woesearchaeota archaeon]